MTEILINLQALAGGETQLLALTGLFLGVLMVTMGGALALAGRDDVERRLALAHGDQPGGGDRGAPRRGWHGVLHARASGRAERRTRTPGGTPAAGAGGVPRRPCCAQLLSDPDRLGLLLPVPLLIGTFGFALNAGSFTVDLPIVGISASSTLVLLALLVCLGFYLPPLYVRRRISHRQRAIREGFLMPSTSCRSPFRPASGSMPRWPRSARSCRRRIPSSPTSSAPSSSSCAPANPATACFRTWRAGRASRRSTRSRR